MPDLSVMNLPKTLSHQDQGYFEVKVILESNCKCLDYYPEAGGGPSTEYFLVISCWNLGLKVPDA